jgi:tRNA dimethylallyltransferase
VQHEPALVVIGGTTASGKSALALRLAEATRGVIVNADSMQLYRDLRVLTARPTPADEARAPHRLYGVLGAGETGSVGRWLDLVEPVLAEAFGAGRTAIVVGGTGLYLEALLEGLAPVPEIPPELRLRLRVMATSLSPPELHCRLAARDPVMAARLRPSDPQRILRALEVIEATGRSLADWQAMRRRRITLPARRHGVALLMSAAMLAPRIEARLRAMLAAGALDEVRALLARGLPSDSPVMKATGVPELRAHLEGRATLDEAVAETALRTRQFARRQRTFFRHRLPELRAVAGEVGDLRWVLDHPTLAQ